MRTIFHITTELFWAEAQEKGYYECEFLRTEGFIHLSRPHQIIHVANSLFRARPKLLLLQVNQDKVVAPVKYEGDDNNKFPHIYGKLNLDSVIGAFPFQEGDSGFFLPPPFKLVHDTLVRPGSIGDEGEIANVHIQSWQQSYKGIIPESYLATLSLQFRGRQSWWKQVLSGNTETKVFVAESTQHGIVGFVAVEPGRDTDFKEMGEVGAIYCLNEYKNKGIGSALFRMGLEDLSLRGFKRCYLWVLEENPTRAFYERVGGVLLSKTKSIELGVPLVEVGYGWEFR